MVQADGANIRVSFFIVVLGQAIPRTAVNPHGFTVEKGKTVVRNIVLVLEKITEVHLSRRAKTQGESWSDSLAAHFDMIAIYDIGSLHHGVQAQSDRGGERLVDIGGAAEESAAAGAQDPVVEALELGSLADLVDDPAGGAATEVYGRGSLEHFDVLNIEGVAEIGPLIAHAIQIHVVARAETAQGEAVPLRATGFTSGNTDAGNIAQRIPQGIRLLLIHDLSWDDGDRLRNVLNRLGQTLQSEVRNDVGTLLFGDGHLGQCELFFLFWLRHLWFRCESNDCQSECKGHCPADPFTSSQGDLVEKLVPPSFIGASFLSTHGSSKLRIAYRWLA